MSLSAAVHSNEAVAPTVRRLILKVSDPAWTFKAGQFVIVPVPQPLDSRADEPGASLGAGSRSQAKPLKGFYSIASAEFRLPLLELLVEHRDGGGYVSGWVSALQPGSLVTLEGPLGHFGLDEGGAGDEAFIGTRAGLAPLRSLLLSSLARHGGGKRWLYVGAASAQDLLLDAEFLALAASEPRFQYVPCVGKDPAAEAAATLPKDARVYAAGFKRDLDPLKAHLLERGFDAARLRFEAFG